MWIVISSSQRKCIQTGVKSNVSLITFDKLSISSNWVIRTNRPAITIFAQNNHLLMTSDLLFETTPHNKSQVKASNKLWISIKSIIIFNIITDWYEIHKSRIGIAPAVGQSFCIRVQICMHFHQEENITTHLIYIRINKLC